VRLSGDERDMTFRLSSKNVATGKKYAWPPMPFTVVNAPTNVRRDKRRPAAAEGNSTATKRLRPVEKSKTGDESEISNALSSAKMPVTGRFFVPTQQIGAAFRASI